MPPPWRRIKSGKDDSRIPANRKRGRNVRVFGLVARAENGPDSGLDFLVLFDPGRNIFDLGALLTDLRDQLHLPVDLVESGRLHPVIRDPVLAEATPLSPQRSRMLTISSSQTSYEEEVG